MLKHHLITAASAMGIAMSQTEAEQFERYHALLVEANARMNLTRVPDDPIEAADRNYLDSISVLSAAFPSAQNAVDVGSGAGFPGVPLAIMLPETHFVLLDSLGKRVDFLNSVIDALRLNAEAVHLRAEDAAKLPNYREQFDLACARAVAPMNVLCEYLLPFLRVEGWMLALKGPSLEAELDQAGNALNTLGGSVTKTLALSIPGRDWDHRAVWIHKTAPTPDRYPRKAGTVEKKPI